MLLKRIRRWLSETHSAQFELVRHFFSQQFAYELTSSDQVRRFFVAILAAFGCAGPLIIRIYMPKYGYLQSLPTPGLYLAAVHADRLFFISLSMIAVGLIAAVQWQSLFPNRQDYLVLKPLPVQVYQIFVARFLASLTIATIVIVDLNLATSVLFPLLTSGKWQFPSFGTSYILAHAVATFGAGLFVFFAIAAIQGICLNVLSPRAFDRMSVLIQAFFVTGFVAAGPYVLDIPNWHEMIAARPSWMSFFPPAWFAGLYERILGTHDAYFLRLSRIAIFSLGTTVLVALGAYFVSYRRHTVRVLEQTSARPSSESSRSARVIGTLFESLIKNPHERAVFDFAIRTLQRSRRHKLLLGFSIGTALVLALQTAGPIIISQLRSGESWSPWQLESVFAVPLIIAAVVISALCYVFQIPSEIQANWVFRMAENCGRTELLNSVERVLVLFGVMPALFVGLLIEVLPLGPLLTVADTALAAVLMFLFIEMRLREWHKIPFTCSYVPGRRNIWQTIGMYFILFGALIPTIAYLEVRLLRPFLLIAGPAVLCILWLVLRSARKNAWKNVPLLFDESDEPLIRSIRLNRE